MSSLAEKEPAHRYAVVFEETGEFHSDSESLEQAKHTARALSKWNHAAKVVDRDTSEIVFRATAHRESVSHRTS